MSGVGAFARDASEVIPGAAAQEVRGERKIHSVSALAVLGLSSLALFVLAWTWPRTGGPWGPDVSTAIAWGAFALHILCGRRYLNGFDPALWIPVVMLLNYTGMGVAVEFFGHFREVGYDALGLGVPPPRLHQAFATAALAVVAFLFGIHLAGFRDLSRTLPSALPEKRSIRGPAMCLLIGGALMTLVGIAIIGPSLLFGSYGHYKFANTFGLRDFRFYGAGMLFLQGGILGVLASHERGRPWTSRIALAGAAALALLLVATGDRGGLSALLFGVGWVITMRWRRIPAWVAVGGVIFSLALTPVMKEFRASRELTESRRRSLLEHTVTAVYDMGAALTAIAYTLEHIPHNKDHQYGMSVLVALNSNIPNFGLQLGSIGFTFDPLQSFPSAWFTATANPYKWMRKGGGYAYAFAAEWYWNFGMVGVFLGMILSGWFTGWIRNRSSRSSLRLTVTGLYIGMMVLIMRNALGYPLRSFLWPLVGLLVLYWMWPVRSRTTGALRPSGLADVSHGWPSRTP